MELSLEITFALTEFKCGEEALRNGGSRRLGLAYVGDTGDGTPFG